jgi:hypothetical protein
MGCGDALRDEVHNDNITPLIGIFECIPLLWRRRRGDADCGSHSAGSLPARGSRPRESLTVTEIAGRSPIAAIRRASRRMNLHRPVAVLQAAAGCFIAHGRSE